MHRSPPCQHQMVQEWRIPRRLLPSVYAMIFRWDVIPGNLRETSSRMTLLLLLKNPRPFRSHRRDRFRIWNPSATGKARPADNDLNIDLVARHVTFHNINIIASVVRLDLRGMLYSESSIIALNEKFVTLTPPAGYIYASLSVQRFDSSERSVPIERSKPENTLPKPDQ